MIKDVATIKQQVEELNRRMERIETRGTGGSNQTKLEPAPSHYPFGLTIWDGIAAIK